MDGVPTEAGTVVTGLHGLQLSRLPSDLHRAVGVLVVAGVMAGVDQTAMEMVDVLADGEVPGEPRLVVSPALALHHGESLCLVLYNDLLI